MSKGELAQRLVELEAQLARVIQERDDLQNRFENLGAVLEKDFQLGQVDELVRNIHHWFAVLFNFSTYPKEVPAGLS